MRGEGWRGAEREEESERREGCRGAGRDTYAKLREVRAVQCWPTTEIESSVSLEQYL